MEPDIYVRFANGPKHEILYELDSAIEGYNDLLDEYNDMCKSRDHYKNILKKMIEMLKKMIDEEYNDMCKLCDYRKNRLNKMIEMIKIIDEE